MQEIKARCELTQQQYRAYMKFHVLGRKKDLIIHAIGAILLFLFGLANMKVSSPILGWTFIALALYFLVSRYLRFFISVNRIVKQFGLTDTPKYFYSLTFHDHTFDISNNKESARYEYRKIHHVNFMDQDQLIFLYMTADQAFLIPYSAFSSGSASLLKQLLSAETADGIVTED